MARQRWSSLAASAPLLLVVTALHAHEGTVVHSGFGQATIDGKISAGEWHPSAQTPVTTDFPGSYLVFQNDEDFLYVGLFVTDTSDSASDRFVMRFDNNHNGIMDEGEDMVSLIFEGPYYDLSAQGGFWAVFEPSQDGSGTWSDSVFSHVFEFVKPLNSGDALDFALTPGDTVGFCMRYCNDGSCAPQTAEFPPLCSGAGVSRHADLVLEAPSVSAGLPAPGNAGLNVRVVPNPIRLGSPTFVAFSVPAGGADVDIAVYDVSGRRIARLADGQREAGRYTLKWDPARSTNTPHSTGVYFLKVKVGSQLETERILVLQ